MYNNLMEMKKEGKYKSFDVSKHIPETFILHLDQDGEI